MEIILSELHKQSKWNKSFLVTKELDVAPIKLLEEIQIDLKIISVGENKLLEGVIKGKVQADCRDCTQLLVNNFELPLKILLEFDGRKGIFWSDDVDEVDNYCVSIGFQEPRLAIITIIREQILLNLDMSANNLLVDICSDCKETSVVLQETQEVKDTPWLELEKIKEKLHKSR